MRTGIGKYLEDVKSIKLNGWIRRAEQIHRHDKILRVVEFSQCDLQVRIVGEENGDQLHLSAEAQQDMGCDSCNHIVPVAYHTTEPTKDLYMK